MADTANPTSTSPDPSKDAARIGTSNDKSWAGWAISSFTNKITTANGEIQPTAPNGAKPVEAEPSRSASVPRPVKTSASAQLDIPKETVRPTAQPLGRRSQSEQPVPITQEDDFDDGYDAWGAMDDEDEDTSKKAEDAFDPFSPISTTASTTSSTAPAKKSTPVPYDDGGEPDFAGWLAAQSKTKKPLPKGLNKTTAAVSPVARTASRNSATKSKTVAPKKIDTTPKDEDEDDGWGAWD